MLQQQSKPQELRLIPFLAWRLQGVAKQEHYSGQVRAAPQRTGVDQRPLEPLPELWQRQMQA